MPSWRTSISFDIVDDHDLIVYLQSYKDSGSISQLIRTALRAHLGQKATLDDILSSLSQVITKLDAIASRTDRLKSDVVDVRSSVFRSDESSLDALLQRFRS